MTRGREAKAAPPKASAPEIQARLQAADRTLRVNVLGDSGPRAASTRIVVEGVCDRLTLDREAYAGPHARDVETGDPDFDRTFVVMGPPAMVLALLDAETRRLLRVMATYRTGAEVAVERGALRVDLALSHRRDARTVEERGREAVAAARRLRTPANVARRLAENARTDPVPAVRIRALDVAAREHPADPATKAALRAGVVDRHPEVRLCAALALGPEGRDALLSLIEGQAIDDAQRAAAIRGLGDHLPDALLARQLRRCVGAQFRDVPGQSRTARACVAALGYARGMDSVSTLQALLLANVTLAPDAARALARLGGPDAEAALIGALGCDIFESRLAAAEALGEAGTIAAVAALRAAERTGVAMRRVARAAVAAIQSRATAAPGAVTLTGGEAGQVSIADDAAGRVSLPGSGRKGK